MSATTDQNLAALKMDPTDARAFEALEEHYFMAGEWDELVRVYEQRLAAPDYCETPAESLPLLFRLAQLLEDRCLDPERAIPVYWQVAKNDPSNRHALRQLRQIYADREQWDMVLQIAEMESQIPMEGHQKATFFTEIGDIWLKHLQDTTESRSCYERALAETPDHAAALAGLAAIEEKDGRHREAADAWQKLSERLRGPDRSPVLVSLGKLLAGPLSDTEGAADCFRRAMTDDPRSAAAVECLATVAKELEDWNQLAELYTRRFDLTAGARARTSLAVEAGRFNLSKLDNTQAARMWFDRALDLIEDDVSIHDALAELERRTGDRVALGKALQRVIELGGDAVPASYLLESAELRSEQGDEEGALELLRSARDRAPDDPDVADALADSLSRQGLMSELVEVLEQRAALSADDETKAAILARMGDIHESDLADAEAAIECLSEAFATCPAHPGVATALVRLHRKHESWNELHALLLRATEEGPQSERAGFYASLGCIARDHLDDAEGATRAFETALSLGPDNAVALQGLEDLAVSSGDEDAILRAYQREAATTTDRGRLAFLVWKLVPLLENRDRPEDAVSWLEKLSQLIPEDRKALENLARLREALGREDDLRDALERLDPLLSSDKQAENRRRLAALHAAAGRCEESVDLYQAALESDANDLESLRALKNIYEEERSFEPLARTLRQLADLLPAPEQPATLNELSLLLEEQLGDLDGAIVVLWRLAQMPMSDRPANVSPRLEALLERAGRYEELAQQLVERRRRMTDEDPEVENLDMRRAQLLADHLGQYEDAARIFRRLLAESPQNETALRGLERCLRSGNDSEGMANFLCEQAARCDDAHESGRLLLERAELLEDALGAFDEALEAFDELSQQSDAPEIAERAGARLEELLNRCGDWPALRGRWNSKLGRGTPEEDLALHESLALLCRDRLHDSDGCVKHWEAAGRLAPERASIWHNLALLYDEVGRPADLLRVIESELETEPDHDRECTLRSRAAKLCGQLGDRDSETSRHYERLLTLQPGHSEGSEFLIDFYEREEKPRDVVRLLEGRLEIAQQSDEEQTTIEGQISLRLRIAKLLGDALDDLGAAIETLEPALDSLGPRAIIAFPLADFYQRAECDEKLIALCEQAARLTQAPDERAQWHLRMGDALGARGESSRAAEAYRNVLDSRPNDLDAQSALRDLYRELGQPGPLAELLTGEIERRSGAGKISLQLELAGTYSDELDRDEDALGCLEAILVAEPHHSSAFLKSIALNRKLGRHEKTSELLEAALGWVQSPLERAALLEQQGDLLAGALDRVGEAIPHYREVLTLDPGRQSVRHALRAGLEKLGRWSDALDCLFLEAQKSEGSERTAIYEDAIEIAKREISSDATLPWLERLHDENPEDLDVLVRIASIHRQAGRPEALMRALDAQLELTLEPMLQREIYFERARIFERDLSSPGRALKAMEAARSVDPRDREVLIALDRLYEATARPRDRVGVVEARIACAEEPEADLAALRRSAASLWSAELADPNRAVPHLLHSISLTDRDDPEMLPMLGELAENLSATGKLDAWARAVELDLEIREARADGDDLVRRYEIHRELADCYGHILSRSEMAHRHLLALLEIAERAPGLVLPGHENVEATLLELLRCDRNYVELEERLTSILERDDTREDADEGSACDWLELARLRDEVLRSPGAACAAYREVLKRDEGSLAAIRGLRHNAEVLRDWPTVADAIDRELALGRESGDAERRALLRRLADICWKRIDPTSNLSRAATAFCRILEIDSDDLESLRSLEQIREQQSDHSSALELYGREVEILDGRDAARRQQVWLRAAEIARDHTDEPQRALNAFEAADEAQELPLESVLEWAKLHEQIGNIDEHVEIFARWCDAGESPASGGDHLALANRLHELGRGGEAAERAKLAVDLDDGHAPAWEKLADLHEEQGQTRDAAESLARAAEIRCGEEAANHLLRASHIVEGSDPEYAIELLRRAADYDSGSARVQARRAIVAEKLELWEEAQSAAGHAIDLAGESGQLAESVRLETALAGGRAAWQREDLDSAAGLFATVLTIEPEHIEALESQGEVLFLCGDVSSARHVLEKRIALPTESDRLARQLSIVAAGFELEENSAEALAHFERALETEPDHDDAHEGIVRILESEGRVSNALEALDSWIERRTSTCERAELLLRAGRLELGRDGNEQAETYLRRAVEDDPELAPAWVALAQLMWQLERGEDALEITQQGLAAVTADAHDARAVLSLVAGRALEQRGEHRAAAEAFGEVLRSDGSCAEAALGRARLLRKLGDWQESADGLKSYLEQHPQPYDPQLAEVHYKLGRLLAGPLEEVEEAAACYERALELDPEFSQAREPLANLLAHIPERWRDALARHQEILAENPFSTTSARSILQITREREMNSASKSGLAILRALGSASPEEFSNAPAQLDLRLAEDAPLSNPTYEKIRRLARQTAQEIAQALSSCRELEPISNGPSDGPSYGPYRAFWDTMRGAEAEFTAPGFEAVGDETIAKVMCHVAALALATELDGADPELTRALDRSIGRWARRKLPRILDGLELRDVVELDWSDWRKKVRLEAACMALDRCEGDLRSALITLSNATSDGGAEEVTDATDISQRAKRDELARLLLGRVIQSWCSKIANAN